MTKALLMALLDKQSKSLMRNMNDDDIKLLEEYTDIKTSKMISNYLLTNDPFVYDEFILKNKIECLESLIRRSVLKQKLVVYHGCAFDIKDDYFDSKAFLSTSLDYSVAHSFARCSLVEARIKASKHNESMANLHSVILKITLPAGSNGLWLRPFSLCRYENELLLQDDNSYKVIDRKEQDDIKLISLRLGR